MFYLNSRREKLINARYIASVLFEVLKTVTNTPSNQVFLFFLCFVFLVKCMYINYQFTMYFLCS